MIQDIWLSLPFWLQALCIGFASVWLIQVVLFLVINIRPLVHISGEKKHKYPEAESLPPISVVVYAHNQSEDLLRNLPVLLDSPYPDFEVIVIDDGSSDETKDVLTQLDQRSEHFFHTTIAEHVQTVSHRKLALLLAVKAAHNEIVLMTQAQCIPATPNWLASIGRKFATGVDAVIGPVVYENRVGLLNRFYQWDFFERMLRMMELTMAVKTFGGWGYNMAFRKEVFYANHNRALQRYLGMHPGEDDLFLNEVTKGNNVVVACSSDAVIINQQSPIHYNWKRERLNRAFTQRYYFAITLFFKHFDVLTRYLCIFSGLGVIGWSAWIQSWWVMGTAIALLFLHGLGYALINYFICKGLRIHRYLILPLIGSFFTPVVDMIFNLRVMLKSHQFYVGRVDD